MIHYLGYTNFRRFKEFDPLRLGGITMLVGKNNAGKSTFVKAMLLMHNFVSSTIADLYNNNSILSSNPEFHFDVTSPYDVHIGTYKRAHNNTCQDSEPIAFNVTIGDFFICVNVSGNVINGELDKESVVGNIDDVTIYDNSKNIAYFVSYKTGKMFVEIISDDVIPKKQQEEYQNIISEISAALETETDFARIIELKAKLDAVRAQAATEESSNAYDEQKVEVQLCNFIDSPSQYYLVNIIESFKKYGQQPTPATIKKNSKQYKQDVAERNFLQSNTAVFDDAISRLQKELDATKIEYIYAHAARQVVFFNSQDKNDYMAQTIHSFVSSKAMNDQNSNDFINYWMREFCIGEGYEYLCHGGEAYELFIKNDAGNTPLADMGMGSIQLMILLLKLATFIHKYAQSSIKPVILLEEPEQNLHPEFQSKLALLLTQLYDNYGLQFVVETHSEYLIRKTQVLAAEAISRASSDLEAVNKKYTVYYFPQNGHPQSMNYQQNGRFDRSFAPGFFDEAGRSNRDLNLIERGLYNG